jgi:hypothetical protein
MIVSTRTVAADRTELHCRRWPENEFVVVYEAAEVVLAAGISVFSKSIQLFDLLTDSGCPRHTVRERPR